MKHRTRMGSDATYARTTTGTSNATTSTTATTTTRTTGQQRRMDLTPTPIPIPLTPRTPRQERAWSFKVRGKRARKKENTYTGLPYTPLPYYSYPRYLRERTVCLRKYAGRRKGKVGLGWRHRRQSSRPACDFGMGVSCRVCQDCHGFLI